MKRRNSYLDERVLEEANLLINIPGASTYTVAQQLNRPQSTVWWHLTHKLPELDGGLFTQVQVLLKKNYRGGRNR